MVKYMHMESPVGDLTLSEENGIITGIEFGKIIYDEYTSTALLNKTKSELNMYFEGKLKAFSIPVMPKGSSFRVKVLNELYKVPYGETVSYKDLAIAAGNKNASRAVGGAVHNNNIVIVIPCHRVIGSDGSLTGFGGGIDKKVKLLELERKYKNDN